MSACWCGNAGLQPFAPGYLRCPACETLVAANMPDPRSLLVSDDERDFYGRQYYETHMPQSGYPPLEQRARLDLPERCLHWLRVALTYKLPPASALELGSAHGAFVALLRWAGFEAAGLELSPWLVDFARRTFDVPLFLGPVEEQAFPPSSLDVIAGMDVLEHFFDPVATMRHCLGLLKPDGVLLIQTPRYPEGKTYQQMASESHPFLQHLKREQHLCLFSQNAIRRFFADLEAPQVEFLPPIFAHYDMFLAVSRRSLKQHQPEEILERLGTSPASRLVEALLRKDDERKGAEDRLAVCEADRAARLEVIEEQGRRLGETEAARNCLQSELNESRRHFEACEADRAARLEVIKEQGRRRGEIEAARNCLQSELDDLRRRFEAQEKSSSKRAAECARLEESLRQRDASLAHIRQTRVYRVLRSLGLLGWLEGPPGPGR